MIDRLERGEGIHVPAANVEPVSRRPRRSSLSSGRSGGSETARIRALREETFVLQDSLEHARDEVCDLRLELQRSREHACRLTFPCNKSCTTAIFQFCRVRPRLFAFNI